MREGLIRIATRQSPLALWQAEDAAARLTAAYPGLQVELVPMTTRGDRILDRALQSVGGKALFIKELEQAMLEDRADIAVHSMKDVPAELPDGFALPCVLEREEPRDAWVSPRYPHPDDLPEGARVGTSSLRRQAQIKHHRPDLAVLPLRGNVGTRLGKLDSGEFDAIILAGAGLIRLELEARIACLLEESLSLPAVGQGVVGIECRQDDEDLVAALAAMEHHGTRLRVTAERAVNHRLGGSCHVPIAAYAELDGSALHLRARVGAPDGSELLHDATRGPADQAESLGVAVAEALLARGADRILADAEH